MASVFHYRKGWRCQVVTAAGERRTRDFSRQRDALAWGRDFESQVDIEKAPRLGGPTRVTLGELLVEYAHAHTVAKQGRKSEVNRINHYLTGQPALKARQDDAGRWSLVPVERAAVEATVANGWKAYLDRRRSASARTYAVIATLGARRVSSLQGGTCAT